MLVPNLSAVLMALAIAGILVRGRHSLCWSFLTYLSVLLLVNRLQAWFPEVFYTPAFWEVKKGLYDVLRVCVALEVAALTFWAAPRAAQRRAAAVLAAVIVVIAGLRVGAAVASPEYLVAVGRWAPRIETVCVWLFTAVVVVAAQCRVPVHPYHRTIVLGFGAFLMLDVVTLGLVGAFGKAGYQMTAALGPVAFAATVGVWAVAAWRPRREAADVPEAVRRLQPWASSW